MVLSEAGSGGGGAVDVFAGLCRGRSCGGVLPVFGSLRVLIGRAAAGVRDSSPASSELFGSDLRSA